MLFYKWSPIISIIIIISKIKKINKYKLKLSRKQQKATAAAKKNYVVRDINWKTYIFLRWNAIEKMQMNKNENCLYLFIYWIMLVALQTNSNQWATRQQEHKNAEQKTVNWLYSVGYNNEK